MKHTKTTLYIFLMLALIGFKAKATPMVTKTFHQISGNGWSTASNWGGSLPVGSDNVQISGNCYLGGTGACNDLTIDAGDTLFLSSGSNLTINGTISMNGYIKVLSGAITVTKNFSTIPGITYNKLVIANGKSILAGGPITINNDLVIGNNAILDDNNEVITVKGNISNNGTHQSGGSAGKIKLNGSGTQTINSTFLNPFSAHCHFGNLELDNPNGARVGASTSSNVVVEVTNGFTMTQGNLNVNTFTFIVGDPSTGTGAFSNPGNGIISGSVGSNIVFMGDTNAAAVYGLIVNTNGNLYLDVPEGVRLGGASTIGSQLSLIHGLMNQNGYDLNIGKSSTSYGKILFQNNGFLRNSGSTGNLTLSGTNGTSIFSNLKVDSLAGLTVNTPGGVSLFANVYIKNRLTIAKGFLNLNGKDVILSFTASLSEAAGQMVLGTGFIYTYGIYSTALNNLNIAGLGLSLSTSSAMGLTTIYRSHSVWTSNGHSSIKKTFKIVCANNVAITKMEFNYDSTELNGKNRSDLVISNSLDGGANWTSLSSCIPSTGSYPTGKVSRYVSYNLSGIALFTACEASNPLSPVFVEELNHDIAPISEISAYPNPTSNTFTVALDANEGRYMFVLTDLSGRVLQSTQMETTVGMNNLNFDVSEYSVGVYILTISNGGEVKNIKIQKQ